MNATRFYSHLFGTLLLTCLMFIGSSLLARPHHTGGFMNFGGVLSFMAGWLVLVAAQYLAAKLYPETTNSWARRCVHLLCWLTILVGMLYAYIKFPSAINLFNRCDDLDEWIQAGQFSVYSNLFFASISLYMAMYTAHRQAILQFMSACTAHMLAFFVLQACIGELSSHLFFPCR